MNTFYPGEAVHPYITSIASSSGGTVDPTPLLFSYWPAGVSVATVATTSGSVITKDSNGNYHAEVVPTTSQSGEWLYRWSSTGSYRLAQWGSFRVLDVPAST